jgi:hypothetical protein
MAAAAPAAATTFRLVHTTWAWEYDGFVCGIHHPCVYPRGTLSHEPDLQAGPITLAVLQDPTTIGFFRDHDDDLVRIIARGAPVLGGVDFGELPSPWNWPGRDPLRYAFDMGWGIGAELLERKTKHGLRDIAATCNGQFDVLVVQTCRATVVLLLKPTLRYRLWTHSGIYGRLYEIEVFGEREREMWNSMMIDMPTRVAEALEAYFESRPARAFLAVPERSLHDTALGRFRRRDGDDAAASRVASYVWLFQS